MRESAPGENGLTIGFYKKYFPYFGKYFVDILNNECYELPDTFNKCLIKFVPKKSLTKKKNIKSFRISYTHKNSNKPS